MVGRQVCTICLFVYIYQVANLHYCYVTLHCISQNGPVALKVVHIFLKVLLEILM